jgi:hypothetical protein
LFPLFHHTSFLNVWKIQFCEAEFERCARHKLASAAKPIPPNLLPNGRLMPVPKKEG